MKMKIAVPITAEKNIDSHFGQCESYGVYTISEKNEISGVKTIKSESGCGCKSDIASVLSSDGVKVMLAGGIGGGAINVFNNNGIEVVRGCSGNADDVVRRFIQGLVKDSGSSCQHHESHNQEGHQCSQN
jgi:predicted Fe-Mo cluster-binding NifX family protein